MYIASQCSHNYLLLNVGYKIGVDCLYFHLQDLSPTNSLLSTVRSKLDESIARHRNRGEYTHSHTPHTHTPHTHTPHTHTPHTHTLTLHTHTTHTHTLTHTHNLNIACVSFLGGFSTLLIFSRGRVSPCFLLGLVSMRSLVVLANRSHIFPVL